MDAVALAVAAALLVVGVGAFAVRRRLLGLVAGVVGLSLPVMAYSDELGASASAAPTASSLAPMLAPLVALGMARPRTATVVAAIAGLIAGPVRTALYDPFYDPTCFVGCAQNPLALFHLSSASHRALWIAAYAVALALGVAAVRGPDGLTLGLLAAAALGLALWRDNPLPPSTLTGGVALAITGFAVAGRFETRARLSDLSRALESSGDVESTLRAATGDPGLTVTFDLDNGRIVRPDGTLAEPDPPEQLITDLVGPEGVVARVHHQAGAAETAALATAVRGPGRLAIENSRLAVQVICEAEELEASRRRIVTQADVERRRLERDLHDSAQQHVLALGLALRSALDRATDDETRDVLHRSVASTYQVLDELRDLSHGFYPASLEQTGLPNALDGIIDRAPVPVSVIGIPPGRLPAQVERAIYLLMARITASARHPLTADIRREHDRVVIDIGGTLLTDGVLADVFAVLGGTLTVEEGSDPTVHGELPIETVPEDA